MIKFGIVGAGVMGHTHASTLGKIKDSQVVAIVDKLEDRGKEMAESLNAKYYKNLDELLKNTDVDCINICVPTFEHPQMAIKAANAGKNILCEKPLALSLEEADEMIKAVKINKVKAMTGYELRFWPEYVKIKEIVDSGFLGEPIHAFCQRVMVSPNWRVDNWDKIEKLGGGAAFDLQSHDIDTLIWLFGKPEFVKAQGVLDPDYLKQGGFAHIFTTIQFKNGKSAFAEGGQIFKGNFPFTMALRILCEKGTIEFIFKSGKNYDEKPQRSNIIIYENDGSVHTLDVEQKDAVFDEISYLIDCIKKNKPIKTAATFEDGRAAVELMLAAIKSAKEQTVVKL